MDNLTATNPLVEIRRQFNAAYGELQAAETAFARLVAALSLIEDDETELPVTSREPVGLLKEKASKIVRKVSKLLDSIADIDPIDGADLSLDFDDEDEMMRAHAEIIRAHAAS